MKKFLFATVLLMSAISAYAGPIVFGTCVTITAATNIGADAATITNTADAVTTAGSILEIIAQDDGNTAVSRSIAIWDSTGTTKLSRTFAVGQVIPVTPLPNQIAGPVSVGPLVVVHSGRSITGHLYVKSDFACLILIKR